VTRVLVVEDEESYSDALAYMLRKEGFEVAIAATGPEALTEFDRAGADIVLLDLMLPGLPGTEVCRLIRQTSNVPIIMVSAKDDEVDKVVGLELGADDYICKPFSPREVVARVKAVLRRSTPRALRVYGRFTLDREAHEVTADGAVVALTAREFELLALFADHPRQVLTREQIFERVWGSWGDRSAVAVYVRRLREKLDPALFVTVWGVGYRFDPPAP
jgi:two-component system response regulator RegX3